VRKTLFCVLMIPLLLLSACSAGSEATAEDVARTIRTEYLAASGCGGQVNVIADYGLRVYEFTLEFQWSREGETVLTILSPEEIAGLTARIKAGQSLLEYDSISLGTGDLTGEGLTPMKLVPGVLGYILDGYMAECVFEELGEASALRVLFRDPEGSPGQGTECTLWFDAQSHSLLQAEWSYDGTMVLSGAFTNFYLGDDLDDGDNEGQNVGGDQPG